MSLHVYKPPEPEIQLSKWRFAVSALVTVGLSAIWAQLMVWFKEPNWAGTTTWFILLFALIVPYGVDWCLREVESDEPDQDS